MSKTLSKVALDSAKSLLIKYLNYPSYIALQEKRGYFTDCSGIEYFVAVHEHAIPLEITDYNNGLIIIKNNNEDRLCCMAMLVAF